MNAAHLHLVVNHFPVIGSIIGLMILSYAYLRKNDQLIHFIFIYFFVFGVVTVLVYLTGEPAEEFIEHMSGVSKELIETHEEAGEVALIFSILTGVISAVYIFFNRQFSKYKMLFLNILLVLVLITCFLMGWAANMGGKIRHPEASQSNSSAIVPVGEED